MAIAAKDISRWQGGWVDTGEQIVMVKVSGGDRGLYIDPQAANNYNQVISSGKAFGGYHFAGGTDPIAEANYFLNAMKPWNPGEVPALDWEVSHPDPVGWCLSFVNQVHDVAGAWPLLYINYATLKAYNWTPVLNNCGLWLADWTNNPDSTIDVGYQGYVMLQYSDGPNYDHDEWEYDIETFKKYGWPTTTPQPTPTPAPDPTPAPQPTPQPTTEPTPQPVPTPQEPTPTPSGETTPPQSSEQAKGKINPVSLWNSLPVGIKHVIHSLWQVGVSSLVTHLLAAKSTADVQASFTVAGTTLLAAIKALIIKVRA